MQVDNLTLIKDLSKSRDALFKEVGRVIIGQRDILEHLFMAMLCQGHVLLEGVPGLAKTLIIKTLAETLDLSFSRIQFTPDLMPSDITGTEIIQESGDGREFKFYKGPIFAQIILADEINRTPPKTQAALLEAMEEHRVTAAGTTYLLEEPFFVMATQNPIEQEGTYPLPEAQLDRFMFHLRIDYPSRDEEVELVNQITSKMAGKVKHSLKKDDILTFQSLVREVPVAENVANFAVDLVRRTRPDQNGQPDFISQWVEWGAGPRASQYLILGAKVKAALDGRSTPDIEDVTSLVKPVMRHRIITNFNAEAEGISTDDILDQLIASMS
ncbi:MAG: MoxR family ATPase [Candidatus Marinimicrobia bacterium]|nr:MoxR family ATPase [Candidatus Neomarinimicrobiota bacterium]